MKPFLPRLFLALERLGNLVQSKTTIARRTLLRTEERERAANEVERLDRLRNPQDYRGR